MISPKYGGKYCCDPLYKVLVEQLDSGIGKPILDLICMTSFINTPLLDNSPVGFPGQVGDHQ